MNRKISLFSCTVALSVFGVTAAIVDLRAEPTKIANGPLATAGAASKPNLMFVLDDSGSMQQDATPDFVQDRKLCRRSGDNPRSFASSGSAGSNALELCRLGDPPYMNNDFNYQYYNPGIRYQPALNFDGTERTSYTDLTNVPTDAYGVRSWNQFYTYGQVTTVNLTTQYPDRVWCNSTTASASDTTNCKRNGISPATGYSYPNNIFKFSRDAGVTAQCGSAYPDGSAPAPDYDCRPGMANTIAIPKYLNGSPYYYNIIPSEHCTNSDLTTCIASATPTTVSSVVYNVPSTVRFCNSALLSNCQGKYSATFAFPRFNGVGASGTLALGSGGTSTQFSSIKVNGVEVLGSNSTNISNVNLAADLATKINSFVSSPEYHATVTGSTVTIIAAEAGAGNGFVITFTRTSTRSVSVTNLANAVDPANFQRVNIVPSVTSYPKGSGRLDCAGTTCTYAEESVNFANWYAYYRTRMGMMKSAAGRSFATLDDAYRVGFITINPGSPVLASRYLRVDDFAAAGGSSQKAGWYQKLYGTGFNGSTPLREAASRVGRYFANVRTGINNGMDASPIQLSCQQNFMILSTDGYWNGNGGQTMTDGTAIGNNDNSLGTGAGQVPRPLYDGGTGASGTLADVTQYYYATDLRPDLANNVPTTQKDTASHQHMTTFTIGLGLAGQLKFEGNYETSTTGDFFKLKQGTINWPTPAADAETALDDLWHAAVNGRGQFFSARDPQQVVEGLGTTLSLLQARIASGAAAATSNLQPVAGDNFAFTAEYTTQEWTGDLKARTLDLNTGALSTTALWSARTLLEARAASSRNIFTATSDVVNFPNKLKSFTWTGPGSAYPSDTTLTTAEQGLFNPNRLGQYAGYSLGQRNTATAKNLVNFLRGDKTLYDSGASPTLDTDLYRPRVAVLGDIIDAQPAYVRVSPLPYSDPGHAAFVRCTDGSETGCPSGLPNNTPRLGTVFAAANDGMLHAIDTDGSTPGAERWAFIPSMVLPEMYRLAGSNYATQHHYYTDGSPVVGDICVGLACAVAGVPATDWRTILVAGLNAGGRGFYALDITNPSAGGIKLMWEFKVRDPALVSCALPVVGTSTDCDLGFSFGNPIITKRRSDSRWVVLVTSGYNNVNPGSGSGFLYVLDAKTGLVLNKIGLAASAAGVAGTASPVACLPASVLPLYPYCDSDPIGLAKINNRIESNETDNTTLEVYGGDLKGRLWRFDLTSALNVYPEAFLLANLLDAGGNGQPVTTRPEVGVIPQASTPAVFVATGKYLGTNDPGNSQGQTVYAIKSNLSTTLSNPRGGALVSQTIGADQTVSGGVIRTITSSNSVDWATNSGWYVDLPLSGERVNVDPTLQIGTLIVASNIPETSSCTVGGFSYLNFFDYTSGRALVTSTNSAVSQKIAGSLIVGTNTVKLPGNKLVTITTTADNKQLTFDTPLNTAATGGRRVSWREIIDQ